MLENSWASCLGILHICRASKLRHKSNPSPFHQSLHPLFLAEPLPNPHHSGRDPVPRLFGPRSYGLFGCRFVRGHDRHGMTWEWPHQVVYIEPEVGSWMKKSWQHAKKNTIFPGESPTRFFVSPQCGSNLISGECVWFLEFPTINANLYSIQIFSLPEGDRYLEIRFSLDIP